MTDDLPQDAASGQSTQGAEEEQHQHTPLRDSKGWDGKLRIGKQRPSNSDGDNSSANDDDDDDDDSDHETQQPAQLPPAAGAQPPPSSVTLGSTTVNKQATILTDTPIDSDADLTAPLPSSDSEVSLVHSRVSSLAALGLARFGRLRTLCLRQNAVRRIELPPALRATLEELELYDNLVREVAGLDGFARLKVLDLSFNKIKRIQGLDRLADAGGGGGEDGDGGGGGRGEGADDGGEAKAGAAPPAPALEQLYLVQNRISRIENLSALTSLRTLELGANRIRQIANLAPLANLTELWLGKNKIARLEGLDALVNLRILAVQSNRLTSVEGLPATLTKLEQLHLSHNAIASLAALPPLPALRTLDISSNPVPELAPHLTPLAALEELWASDCALADFDDVRAACAGMRALETVYFEGNPLQRRQPALYRGKVRLAVGEGVRQIDATFVRA